MTLTRENAEYLLIPRVGPLMTAADMDGTTVGGYNLDLNGPIGRAIRDLGYTVADVVVVANVDVAQITDAQIDEFLDTATLYALEAVLGNLDDVDLQAGPRSEKFSQLAEQAERKIARLRAQMERSYGYGLSVPSATVITINLAEHD